MMVCAFPVVQVKLADDGNRVHEIQLGEQGVAHHRGKQRYAIMPKSDLHYMSKVLL